MRDINGGEYGIPVDARGQRCENDYGNATQEVRDHNIGSSDYSKHKIQPWDIWLEYKLNPWDADIIKRVLRTKEGDSRELDYQKIKHICDERIRQLKL